MLPHWKWRGHKNDILKDVEKKVDLDQMASLSVCSILSVRLSKYQEQYGNDQSAYAKSDIVYCGTYNIYHIYHMYLDRQAWGNSVNPEKMPQNMASHQGLHCLPLIKKFLNTTSGSILYLVKF